MYLLLEYIQYSFPFRRKGKYYSDSILHNNIYWVLLFVIFVTH